MSVTKHNQAQAVARGRARVISTAWTSIVFAIILGLVGLVFYAVPQHKSCVMHQDCDGNDRCEHERCKKATRSVGFLIGGLVCVVLAVILGFVGKYNFTLSKDTTYDEGVGEQAYQRDAIRRAQAPYLAAGAMIADAASGNRMYQPYF